MDENAPMVLGPCCAFPQVCKLYDAFHNGPGVFGKTREDMPEYLHLKQIPPEDRVNVLTVAAAMDYQTDADRLWKAAAETYSDPGTRWLFDMAEVARRPIGDVQQAMSAHRFTGRYPIKNAQCIYKLSQTFVRQYAASPIGLLEKYGYDASAIYGNRKKLKGLPLLTGDKILAFWLRILKDVARIDLKNIEKVPMPVDVHVARATLRIVDRSNGPPNVSEQKNGMILKWFDICRTIGTPQVYPLAMDAALWLLSRHGCSGTDGRTSCPNAEKCVVAEFCVFQQR